MKHSRSHPDSRQEYDILFIDGGCAICSKSASFVMRHDPGGRFRVASQQSDIGKKLLEDADVASDLTSVIVLSPDTEYRESDAIAYLLGKLAFPWSAGAALRIVPRPVRDGMYRAFATRRHALGSHLTQACTVPPPALRSRILDYGKHNSGEGNPSPDA